MGRFWGAASGDRFRFVLAPIGLSVAFDAAWIKVADAASMASIDAKKKTILVTGANAGIGLALVKLLVQDHGCRVFLGSRSVERGEAALKEIVAAVPEAAKLVEVLEIDVGSDASVAAAAASVKAKGVTLYALVNNAGCGLAQKGVRGTPEIMNTNYAGPKRVSEAFLPLIDPAVGRIVNTSSGAASMWLKKQKPETKKLYSDPMLTQEALDASLEAEIAAGNVGFGDGYGLSKAALTAYTLIQARLYPNLKCVSLSPGFIATAMTKGYGAKLSPEQGCKSSIKCIFEPVTSGYYYGSDGLRSPLTMTRDPGTPEYEGEDDPDAAKYNK